MCYDDRGRTVFIVTGEWCSEKTLIAAMLDEEKAKELVAKLKQSNNGDTTYDVEPLKMVF